MLLILGGTTAVLIAEKFQTKNLYLFLMAMGASFFILLPPLSTNMTPKTAFVFVCLASMTILYETWEENLSFLFGIIAVLTIGMATFGKRVYAQLQKADPV